MLSSKILCDNRRYVTRRRNAIDVGTVKSMSTVVPGVEFGDLTMAGVYVILMANR
jgi:hypothetical protein